MVNSYLLKSWSKYRAACVGKWFVEIDKDVRLYCEAVDDHGPRMSYRPGDPIAVCPQWADFGIHFKEAPAPLPAGAKYGVERCLEWLRDHAMSIEAQIDDECDGADADEFCAQSATIHKAAREMAVAFGVEWKQ